MTERDQVARPFRGHDPGELRRRQGVALRQLVETASRLRRHPQLGRGNRAAPGHRLVADIDHAHGTRVIDVREPAHDRETYRAANCASERRCSQAASASAASPDRYSTWITPRKASVASASYGYHQGTRIRPGSASTSFAFTSS